jgi:hypothetical protein
MGIGEGELILGREGKISNKYQVASNKGVRSLQFTVNSKEE